MPETYIIGPDGAFPADYWPETGDAPPPGLVTSITHGTRHLVSIGHDIDIPLLTITMGVA